MHSQPFPTPAATVPMPAPRPAARARRLRRPRHPRLRPTRDPRTLWRGRDTAWSTLRWPVLRASLPAIAATAFTNERGEAHAFETAIGLDWPANGMLTNAERRSWSRRPLTSCRTGNAIHPQELAAALHDTLCESVIGAPRHWDTGATALGEWWALRARYPHPDGEDAAPETVETVITVQHAIGSPDVLIQGGLRLPRTGAEIATASYYVLLRNKRIVLPNSRDYELMTTLAHQARSTAVLIASWSEEALLRPALASWAGTVATQAFGHTAAATLMAQHDRWRFPDTAPRDPGSAPMNTAADVAWSLADQLRSVPDIERRTLRQQRIIKAVSELCWWNEQDDAARGYAELVH